MKITTREDKPRKFVCIKCKWKGYETEFTSEDEDGNDLCPACNGNEFDKEED